jgi:hypothetical protein
MPGKFRCLLAFLCSSISVTTLFGQINTNTVVLSRMSRDIQFKRNAEFTRALQLAKQKGWFVRKNTLKGGVIALVGVDELGNPRYIGTFDNIIAAATTNTNQLWAGGSSGLNLSGSSVAVKGKIGIWDGGHALTTHVELAGRISVLDNSPLSDHATHTTGTLIATGINPIAKGMAFQTQQLLAYDFDNDIATMTAQAPNLLVSNHSYGYLAGSGWSYDGTNWYWYGDTTISKSQAYGFGYYDQNAQLYDSIAYNAPFYLICVAAGNPRAYNGPAVGQTYKYNGNATVKRSVALDNNPTFTSVCNIALSKNDIVVGAVNGIPSGYSSPGDVVMSDFSAWGPSNDGRIKPDVVADGVNVTSTWSTSNTAYSTQSGTSMATPNVTGSLYLLQEYYTQLHPSKFLRAATLKGLAIHTADEAGPANGPDYMFGFGLLDALKAANVITSSYHQQSDTIIENSLNNGQTYTFNVVASGKGQLVATLSWTDPPANPVPVIQALNNITPMLVNDLDMRITSGAQVFSPWVLDPKNPSNPATKGDNFRDNVEKINVDSVAPGQTYTITITHKGTLARGQQAFSLLVSGIGGQAYCTSAPTSNAGTRIDSVNFSNLHNANPPGCTTYTNYTNLTAGIQPNQKLPISIKLSSCDASTASKVVKVYIDYNNNGVFDANELAAQSAVLNGNVTYNDTIVTPAGLTIGDYTTMRIVAEETTDPTTVTPCGTYGKGETQDYRVQIIGASNDVGVAQLVSPSGSNGVTCPTKSELVAITIKNFGSVPQVNVPVTTIIKNGNATVATFSTICPDTIPALGSVVFTYQSMFNAIGGNTYTFTSYTSLSTDQQSSNDTSITSIAISSTGDSATGNAELCGNNEVFFHASPADTSDLAFWYDSAAAVNPIAVGNNASSSVITPGNKYYVGFNDQTLNVGPPNKLVYPNGGYNAFVGNFVTFTNTVPLTIESARLYIGNAGTITFTVADVSNLDTATGSYEYLPYSSTTLNVYPTSPDPIPDGTAINSAEDTGAIYFLNLQVPVTGNHAIIIDCENGANIFRNNMLTSNPYPLGIPGVFTITGNSALSTTNRNLYQQYYYFFYNMNLQLNNCAGSRTAIVAKAATAPVISISNNILSSTAASSYQWYLNGVALANETRQTDTAILSGSYTVEATDNTGCTLTSNAISYISSSAGGFLKVSPNPNNGQFQLQFESATTSNVYVTLTNAIGQKVYENSYPNFAGIFNQQINVGYLSADVYYLKVFIGSNSYLQKIVIGRHN